MATIWENKRSVVDMATLTKSTPWGEEQKQEEEEEEEEEEEQQQQQQQEQEKQEEEMIRVSLEQQEQRISLVTGTQRSNTWCLIMHQ